MQSCHQFHRGQQNIMKHIGIILLLFSISTCAFFFNNEAQILQKLIWSPRQSTKDDQLFDSFLTIDEGTDQIRLSAKAQRALRRADKINSLPGQPSDAELVQYAGYIPVSEVEGRELFYYFVESPKNSSNKPLIVWFNGGPGCSSLGHGAMEEVGPFRVNADGKTLSRFEYSWTHANILFVESPAGVGFSKAKDGQLNGDVRTAKENYKFLVNWLERFPHYQKQQLFLAGESYAGHFIPQLAELIISKNARKSGAFINLKGAMIGNPYVNGVQNRRDQDEYLWRRDFITDEAYEAVKRDCETDYQTDNLTMTCLSARMKAFTCSKLSYNLRANDTVPTIKKIVNKGLRVMLYSGDVDSIVPITNTKRSVKSMHLPLKRPWRPWNCDRQVGGFVEEYQGLTLATVRGAGHMVPSNQPMRAFSLVTHFIQGTPLPDAPLNPTRNG